MHRHYFAKTRARSICMIVCAVFCVQLCLPPVSSAFAQINSEDLVEKGIDAYYRPNFSTAIELLETAVQDTSLRKELAVKAHLYIGGSYYALGDLEKAENAFKNAVQLDPEVKMHRVIFSPDLIAEVEKIIDRRVATIRVSTVPSGANVEIDDEFIGLSPQDKPVFEGRYRIKVSKNGYADQEKTVAMMGGEMREVPFTMQGKTVTPVYREQPRVTEKGGSKKWLWILGGTLVAGGVATYLLWPEDEIDDAMGTLNLTISW